MGESRDNAHVARGIVFSRDRPMQLDALISSYRTLVANPAPLDVIYVASTSDFAAAYSQVEQLHAGPGVAFHLEPGPGEFAQLLTSVMSRVTSPTTFFLVDDIVFIRPFDLGEFAALADLRSVPSMRLGRNITWSYTRNSKQAQPHFRTLNFPELGSAATNSAHDAKLLAWRWRSGIIDWGYPFSLDGNIFVTDTIRDLVSRCEFTSPNTLEASLHRHAAEAGTWWGVCFDESRIVNLPINRVQADVSNLHGSLHQDDLLLQWNAGMRIDVSSLVGAATDSAHQELDVTLVRRT